MQHDEGRSKDALRREQVGRVFVVNDGITFWHDDGSSQTFAAAKLKTGATGIVRLVHEDGPVEDVPVVVADSTDGVYTITARPPR